MKQIEEKIIVRMIFGSHLYGTNTEHSDMDYKGVFLPKRKDILMSRVNKSYSFNTKTGNDKNTSEDVDTELYSLHYFISLACDGQTVALDMLHAPKSMILESSDMWELIVSNREEFYTKNLKAFVGYARRQASKYGIKGSRLNSADEVLSILSLCNIQEKRLSDIWDDLPDIEHIHKIYNEHSQLREYQVCGKKFQETVKISYVIPILEKFIKEYGNRARQARDNQNIDWKAISHALRAAYQVKELLTNNTITFPLEKADLIRDIKQGGRDYMNFVSPLLEDLMDEVEELSEKSALPEKVDRGFWDDVVCFIIEDNVL